MNSILKFIGRNIFYILFAFGVFWHLWPVTREFIIWFTPIYLSLCYGYVLWLVYKSKNMKLFKSAVLISLFTFILEVVGVQTGLIFGNYEYGNVLGPKLFDTILLVGPSWFITIWGFYILIADKLNKYWDLVLVPIIIVIYDVILEPLAMHLDYWNWQGDIIPIQNYAVWGIVSFVFVLLLRNINMSFKSKYAFYLKQLTLAQLGFFIAIRISIALGGI